MSCLTARDQVFQLQASHEQNLVKKIISYQTERVEAAIKLYPANKIFKIELRKISTIEDFKPILVLMVCLSKIRLI